MSEVTHALSIQIHLPLFWHVPCNDIQPFIVKGNHRVALMLVAPGVWYPPSKRGRSPLPGGLRSSSSSQDSSLWSVEVGFWDVMQIWLSHHPEAAGDRKNKSHTVNHGGLRHQVKTWKPELKTWKPEQGTVDHLQCFRGTGTLFATPLPPNGPPVETKCSSESCYQPLPVAGHFGIPWLNDPHGGTQIVSNRAYFGSGCRINTKLAYISLISTQLQRSVLVRVCQHAEN